MLRTRYSHGNWKKKKGVALVEMASGEYVLAEIHWYEVHGIGKVKMNERHFVVCVSTELGEFSGDDLTIGHLYEVNEEEANFLRIIDDAGEDFLYPKSCFEAVSLSGSASSRLHDALVHCMAA